MKLEINKRIEQHLLDIIKILDERVAQHDDDDPDTVGQVISSETILKGSAVAQEDIDEKIKAKFLSRLVREYRRNRERAK